MLLHLRESRLQEVDLFLSVNEAEMRNWVDELFDFINHASPCRVAPKLF